MVRVLGAAQWSECWELLSGQSAGSCSVVRVLELLSGQSAGAAQWSECWELFSGQSAGSWELSQ